MLRLMKPLTRDDPCMCAEHTPLSLSCPLCTSQHWTLPLYRLQQVLWNQTGESRHTHICEDREETRVSKNPPIVHHCNRTVTSLFHIWETALRHHNTWQHEICGELTITSFKYNIFNTCMHIWILGNTNWLLNRHLDCTYCQGWVRGSAPTCSKNQKSTQPFWFERLWSWGPVAGSGATSSQQQHHHTCPPNQLLKHRRPCCECWQEIRVAPEHIHWKIRQCSTT